MGFVIPETLQTNRLFTEEFYHHVNENLAKDGILSIALPGSREYMSQELINLNSSIFYTLSSVFDNVEIVPGEDNILLASESEIELDPEVLANRLEDRELSTDMISPGHLEHRLDSNVIENVRNELKLNGNSEIIINRDFEPVGFFYTLQYWGSMFSQEMAVIMDSLDNITISYLMLMIAIVVLVLYAFTNIKIKKGDFKEQPTKVNKIIAFSIFITGALGMAFDLFIIFIFQTVYGQAYQMTGLLLGCFMLGIYGGSKIVLTKIRKNCNLNIPKLFMISELLLILSILGLAVMTVFVYNFMFAISAPIIIAIFVLFAITAGLPIGIQFPVAIQLMTNLNKFQNQKLNSTTIDSEPKSASLLYSADLIGGWLAGLITSVFLFPVLGLVQSLLVLGSLKLGTLLLSSKALLNFHFVKIISKKVKH